MKNNLSVEEVATAAYAGSCFLWLIIFVILPTLFFGVLLMLSVLGIIK